MIKLFLAFIFFVYSGVNCLDLFGGSDSDSFIPDSWSKQEIKERSNEALLYSNAQRIEEYKKDNGAYPENLDKIELKSYLFKKDLFSGESPKYSLTKGKKKFDLRFTGPDGVFETKDDVVYDPKRVANNLLPMYGGEKAVKTAYLLKADKTFIDIIVKKAGSREKGSIDISNAAWKWLKRGDLDTAMRRFNQAWLLNPASPEPYRGFFKILKRKGKAKEAEQMLKLFKEKVLFRKKDAF